ncbi:hypothetical protein ABEB36_005607 [Hypothenemus hampei]|uniref:Uncharacterized protein n=1 Tax=Hypothenemus hampei TaxID=57062 RepID=A0ABD1EYU2_HYPHA
MRCFLLISFALFLFVSSGYCENYCEDWTLCQKVRCAAPPASCPKDKPYLVYGECGCCQYCSEEPRTGPCGTCGVDVVCKDAYPICHGENTTVSLDYCGCCKVCKDIVGLGAECNLEGPSFSVCAPNLKCIEGVCAESNG